MYREGYEVRMIYLIPMISSEVKEATLACLRKMKTRNFFALCEEEEWWWGGQIGERAWGEGIQAIITVEARVPFSEDFLRQERIIINRSGGRLFIPGEVGFAGWVDRYEKFVYPDEWKKKHQKS